MLAPGGRLVAILSAGVTFRDDRKTRAFRQMVASMGGEFEELPADTFASSGTGVRTVLVMLRRPPLPVADRVAELMATPGADVQLVAGVVSACAVGWVLKRTWLHSRYQPLMLELPPYRWPAPRT